MNEIRAFVTMVFRHVLRDRSFLFFVVALPVAIIVIIGSTFGTEPQVRIGVVVERSGPVPDQIVADLDALDAVVTRRFSSRDDLAAAVRRFEIAAGVVVPGELEARLDRGDDAELLVIGDQTSLQAVAALTGARRVAAEVGGRAAAASWVVSVAGIERTEAERLVGASRVPTVEVQVEDVGEALLGELSPFALTAPQNLVLFVFINTLGAGALVVRSRRVGVLRRVLATPTSASRIIVGLGAGQMTIAMLQSVIILVIGRVGFDVRWGDPLGVVALTVMFGLVGSGAGLLLGAIGRNEDRVGSIIPVVGLVLGALGGCMMPIEVFPEAMVRVAHAVPHYWAMRGWTTLVIDGGSFTDVLGSLGVLALFAFGLMGAATVVLRRDLTGA